MTITEIGRARDARRLDQWILDRPDHHFLAADQTIDDERELLAVAPDQQRLARGLAIVDREQLAERDHRHRAAPALEQSHARLRWRLDELVWLELEDLLDRAHRDHECLRAALEREHVEHRDRHRHAQRERRALAFAGGHRELATEVTGDDAAHDVHAEAAATRLGRYAARREPGAGQDIEQIDVALDLPARLARDRIAIDTAPVIADDELDLATVDLATRDSKPSLRRLARDRTLIRGLDRVIDRVADDV